MRSAKTPAAPHGKYFFQYLTRTQNSDECSKVAKKQAKVTVDGITTTEKQKSRTTGVLKYIPRDKECCFGFYLYTIYLSFSSCFSAFLLFKKK